MEDGCEQRNHPGASLILLGAAVLALALRCAGCGGEV